MRSQTIAATSAASTRSWVTLVLSTMPFAMVAATAVPASAPARLSAPAMTVACSGVRTRVATTVAIAFAASWNPLTNSKMSPSSTTRARRTVALSKLAVLHHDGLDDVGDVLAAIDGHLYERVNVLPLDDLDCVVGAGKELGHRLAPDLVTLVLERVDRDPVLLEALEALEAAKHDEDLLRRAHEHLGLTQGGRPDSFYLEEQHQL